MSSHLIELSATFIECLVLLLTTITASGKRYHGKRAWWLILIMALIPTFLIDLLNQWRAFSYITPLVSVGFLIFISSPILSTGSLLVRSYSCILPLLFIQCIDYILVILFGHFIGSPENFFTLFVTTSGVNRTAFLITNKAIDVILFLLLRSYLPNLSKLTLRLQYYLLALSVVSYTVMQFLFKAVLVPNLGIMQLTVVASWCFLIGFIVAFIAFFVSLTKQEQDKQRIEMLHLENKLMAENYQTLHATQQTYARTLHDFKHHIQTMQDLVCAGKEKSALEYMDALLKTSYKQAAQCHSGNDIVDAIINSKLSEAQTKGISFTFAANLHNPVQIDPVDLCGVLANQLENAFEACMQIPDSEKRLVHAEIKQAQSFIFLKVENAVLSNPFTHNPSLCSTKKNLSEPHGYGLFNIQNIAQKYEGTLRSEFVNGKFVSVVSLCDLPNNTKS